MIYSKLKIKITKVKRKLRKFIEEKMILVISFYIKLEEENNLNVPVFRTIFSFKMIKFYTINLGNMLKT